MRRGAQRVARGVGLAWVGGEGGTHDLAGLLIGEHVPHPVTREHDEAILWPERVRRHVGRGGHEIGAEVRAERRVRLEASVADGARAGQEVLAVGCDDSAEGDLAAGGGDALLLLRVLGLMVVCERLGRRPCEGWLRAAAREEHRTRVSHVRKVQRGAPLHDDHSGGARAAMLWVCRLGIPGDEARVRELEGLPKRLANGGVVAESWLILEGLVQVVLAVLRTQLAAVAVVARDQPLAAAEREGYDSILLVAAVPLERVSAHAREADRRLLALLSLARLACRSPLRLPQGLCCLPLGGSRLERLLLLCLCLLGRGRRPPLRRLCPRHHPKRPAQGDLFDREPSIQYELRHLTRPCAAAARAALRRHRRCAAARLDPHMRCCGGSDATLLRGLICPCAAAGLLRRLTCSCAAVAPPRPPTFPR
mmetsp:Transcript_14032/g.33118  ORF Transcript_14032/g.33118 Transcript_14032/m.33118 type:complete len:422 (-) Transcript_14032:80-1345(-)